MLPPKKTNRKTERPLKLQLQFSEKLFEHSSGLTQGPATKAPESDASQPMMCSKSEPQSDQSHLTGRLHRGFFKQLNRQSRVSVLNPTSAARLIRARMSPEQEEVWVLALSSSKKLVGFEMVFRGTVDSCLVHPRDIIRFLCESNASSYIVGHNHPSGDAEPSPEDWSFTRRLIGCGDLIEIPLLDHIVVTMKGHTSMASMRPEEFGRRNLSEKLLTNNRQVGDHY